MPETSNRPAAKQSVSAFNPRGAGRPFFGMIDGVLVGDPATFDFDGAVSNEHASAIWTWMVRDLAPDLIDPALPDATAAATALAARMPELLQRARAAIATASASPDAERRLKTQLDGEEAWARLPIVLNALKCRGLLDKAQAFGRATNAMTDESALATALQSLPLQDHAVAAFVMQALVGQVTNPSRLITAVIRISGSATEAAIGRAGFMPLVDAMLAHAQNQIPALSLVGSFADVDLTCRSIDRFHRLVRAINGYVELGRQSRWSMVLAALTKTISEAVEPKLRDLAPDVNKALRRHREGNDRLDSDQILSALNGCYVLATVRDCRDSLALNAVFEQTWNQVGQALETHIQRNLEIFRQNPGDGITAARLDASIKMAELRFNVEYAEVLRRARESAERRIG